MLLILQCDPHVPAGIYGEHLREREIPHFTARLFAGAGLPEAGSFDGVLILGGRMGVQDENGFPFLRPLKAYLRQETGEGTPLLGICLGGQLLAAALGGQVFAGFRGEKGVTEVSLTPRGEADPLFAGVGPLFSTFMWHNDSFDLPPGALHLAASGGCPGQAFRSRNAWGLQFHPEVDAAVVAEWSAVDAHEGGYLADFRRTESACRSAGLRIFDNFLALLPREAAEPG